MLCRATVGFIFIVQDFDTEGRNDGSRVDRLEWHEESQPRQLLGAVGELQGPVSRIGCN